METRIIGCVCVQVDPEEPIKFIRALDGQPTMRIGAACSVFLTDAMLEQMAQSIRDYIAEHMKDKAA